MWGFILPTIHIVCTPIQPWLLWLIWSSYNLRGLVPLAITWNEMCTLLRNLIWIVCSWMKSAAHVSVRLNKFSRLIGRICTNDVLMLLVGRWGWGEGLYVFMHVCVIVFGGKGFMFTRVYNLALSPKIFFVGRTRKQWRHNKTVKPIWTQNIGSSTEFPSEIPETPGAPFTNMV